MDIDRPLEEIIDEKRTERRKSSRGGRGRGQRGGAVRGGAAGRGGFNAAPAVAVVPVAANGSVGPVRNKYSGNIAATQGGAGKAAATAAVPLMADGSKVIVSNLPTDVTENQVRVSSLAHFSQLHAFRTLTKPCIGFRRTCSRKL